METELDVLWKRVARRWAEKCDWTMDEAYRFLLGKAVAALALAVFSKKRRRRRAVKPSAVP